MLILEKKSIANAYTRSRWIANPPERENPPKRENPPERDSVKPRHCDSIRASLFARDWRRGGSVVVVELGEGFHTVEMVGNTARLSATMHGQDGITHVDTSHREGGSQNIA